LTGFSKGIGIDLFVMNSTKTPMNTRKKSKIPAKPLIKSHLNHRHADLHVIKILMKAYALHQLDL